MNTLDLRTEMTIRTVHQCLDEIADEAGMLGSRLQRSDHVDLGIIVTTLADIACDAHRARRELDRLGEASQAPFAGRR